MVFERIPGGRPDQGAGHRLSWERGRDARVRRTRRPSGHTVPRRLVSIMFMTAPLQVAEPMCQESRTHGNDRGGQRR